MSLYKINQFQYRILKWLKHELSFMIYETQIIRNVNKKCFVIYDREKPRLIYVNEPYPFQILILRISYFKWKSDVFCVSIFLFRTISYGIISLDYLPLNKFNIKYWLKIFL